MDPSDFADWYTGPQDLILRTLPSIGCRTTLSFCRALPLPPVAVLAFQMPFNQQQPVAGVYCTWSITPMARFRPDERQRSKPAFYYDVLSNTGRSKSGKRSTPSAEKQRNGVLVSKYRLRPFFAKLPDDRVAHFKTELEECYRRQFPLLADGESFFLFIAVCPCHRQVPSASHPRKGKN